MPVVYSFVVFDVKTREMSKTRKIVLISFIVAAFISAGLGSFAKFAHWNNRVCCALVFIGLILATAALVVAMWRPKIH